MKRTAAISAIVSLALIAFLLTTKVSIGIASEWAWRHDPTRHVVLLDFVIWGVGFAIIALLAYLCDFHFKRGREKIVICILILLIGVWADYNLMSVGAVSTYESPVACCYDFATGYLTASMFVENPLDYARHYHETLALDADTTNHLDVHPVGNIIFSYYVRKAAECFPKPLLNFFYNDLIVDMGREIASNWLLKRNLQLMDENMLQMELEVAERISLLFFLFMAIAKILFFCTLLLLMRQCGNVGVISMLTAAATYAPVLFLGLYDTMYFFFGSVICLLLALAVNYDTVKRPIWTLLAGAMMAFSCIFSLAFLAFGLFALLFFMLRFSWKEGILRTLWLILGGCIVVAAFEFAEIRYVQMAFYAWRNNARYFAEAQRSRWLWPPFNFIDMLLFENSVWVLPLLATIPFLWCKLKEGRGRLSEQADAFAVATVVILAILLVSGFSRGEMGRLLLFIFPAFMLSASMPIMRAAIDKRGFALWCGAAYLAGALALTIRGTLAILMIVV